VAEIARHKAGIIKQGVPVITAAQGEALEVIQAEAVDKAAPLYSLGQDFSAAVTRQEGYRQVVAVSTSRYGDFGHFTTNLLGWHQAENSAVGVMTSLILAEKEPKITLAAIRAGLAEVYWPGRFEVVEDQPMVVIDGAHNPDGARALRRTLDEVFFGKNITFLLGILADKDIGGITGELIRSSDDVVIVRPLSDRGAEPEEVATQLGGRAKAIELAASIGEGYKKARLLAGPGGVVCVTGSLYLIGPARKVIYEGIGGTAG
jgi:dihydrofolate synthase/folylpolyglutamate synthase